MLADRWHAHGDVMAEAVAWAARSLPNRPTVPILAGLLVRAEGDSVNRLVRQATSNISKQLARDKRFPRLVNLSGKGNLCAGLIQAGSDHDGPRQDGSGVRICSLYPSGPTC
jgi:hypothetical protein